MVRKIRSRTDIKTNGQCGWNVLLYSIVYTQGILVLGKAEKGFTLLIIMCDET